jgi:hypothetical protein
MNKLILSVLTVIGLLSLAPHAQAQYPVDYFNAGKFMEFTNNENYLRYYSPDGLASELQGGRLLFVKAGATPQVLASYDKIVEVTIRLFNQQLSTWTQAYKDEWNKSMMDPGALNDWLGTNMDTKACFFFWLGNQTMLVGKTVPSEFGWGSNLATAQGLAQPGLQKFTQFAENCPTIFQTLQPPVQAAVKAIANCNEKATNLSKADITAIQKQAAVILLAATKRKLTK